jgi:hypothetical protein
MAVIKIVPMPGAEGQQGETGSVGPQGPQGNPGVQGPAGADAVWYYNGEYNPGASYVVGDVVTYDGQLWYRKHANGGNVGDTPSEGFIWDLLAAKGQDATPIISSGTWDTKIAEISGIVGGAYASEDMHLGRYYTIGDLVFVEVNFAVSTPSDWGNYGSFAGHLPFPIAEPWQSNWAVSAIRNSISGRFFANADQDPIGYPYSEDEIGWIDATVVLFTSAIDGTPHFYFLTSDNEALNTNSKTLRNITPDWPFNLRQAPSPYVRLHFSGVYRRA